MRETPRISVAMSVYNDEAFLADAIRSILNQSFRDFEFLIVDDGSTDRSGAIIDEFARTDPRIRAVHQENRGLIASLNRLIDEARAPLIARMDGDDIALPDRFARQIAFLDANPDVGVLGTHADDIDDTGALRAANDKRPLDHEGIVAALEWEAPLCHPSVMLRRDAVRAVGGYHAAFRHCEDFDLWLRLSEITRLANLSDRLMRYRRSDSQVSVRHAFAQQTGAAIALLAHRERSAGRPDPTEGLAILPEVALLDAVFGRDGATREVRDRLAHRLIYSRHAMRGEGFDLLVQHVADGGDRRGSWRTVARLVRFGLIGRALRLATLLLRQRPRPSAEPAASEYETRKTQVENRAAG